jgi:hypothetical protein
MASPYIFAGAPRPLRFIAGIGALLGISGWATLFRLPLDAITPAILALSSMAAAAISAALAVFYSLQGRLNRRDHLATWMIAFTVILVGVGAILVIVKVLHDFNLGLDTSHL